MELEFGPATRLTIFVEADDRWHHRPLDTEVVHRAHEAGLAGASVFHASEGFGKSERIHTLRLLALSDALPCSIIIADVEERIRAFLPQLDELETEGLVILDPVGVVKYLNRAWDGHR